MTEIIEHVIGKQGVEVSMNRDYQSLDYYFYLRVKRYNRVFQTRVRVDYGELDRRVQEGKLGDLIGDVAQELSERMMKGFVEHLESLGLR